MYLFTLKSGGFIQRANFTAHRIRAIVLFKTSTTKWKQLIIQKIENCRFNVFILHELWIVKLWMDPSYSTSVFLSCTVSVVIYNYVHVAEMVMYTVYIQRCKPFAMRNLISVSHVCLLFLCFMLGSFHCSLSTWRMDNAWLCTMSTRYYVIKTNFSYWGTESEHGRMGEMKWKDNFWHFKMSSYEILHANMKHRHVRCLWNMNFYCYDRFIWRACFWLLWIHRCTM